jgi:hypothetical protein
MRSRQTLGPQLFLHDFDSLKPEVWPIRNGSGLAKPRGGFWTSTYDPQYGSGWVRWCVAHEHYNEPLGHNLTVLSVPESARIVVVNSMSDLLDLIEQYPRQLRGKRGIDFEHLAKEYDALHLTQEGYLRTRSRRSSPNLNGWDCESTVWFRWVFTEWHQVEVFCREAG